MEYECNLSRLYKGCETGFLLLKLRLNSFRLLKGKAWSLSPVPEGREGDFQGGEAKMGVVVDRDGGC